jgi:hypothetical protein
VELPWRVKLRQAERHLRTFEEECDRYSAASHVGFAYGVDAAAGLISVTLQADSEPPMLLGAIVGDVLHNLRSALDSIAWETCQRAGVPPEREKYVYFPVATDPADWRSLAGSQLPNVSAAHLEIFREFQPWYYDEISRGFGIEVDPSGVTRHPLYRLQDLAKRDRHRVPHPILARAGDTWLGAPEGVKVELVQADARPWVPGSVIVRWRIEPRSEVSNVHPDGEPILAFTEEAALHRQSALRELQAMQEVVVQALRRVEIDVLEVVTREQMAELTELKEGVREALGELDSLREPPHVIDAAYIDRYQELAQRLEDARGRYSHRWRELFE